MAIDDGPVIVGGGPVRPRRRDRAAGARHLAGDGDRARARRPAGSRATRTTPASACATCAPCSRGRDTPSAIASWPSEAGVEVLTETMVTDWEGDRRLKLTGPAGRQEIEPPAVVLATGCRERPRSARLVPGLAARRGDDDRHAAAARPPARREGGTAGGDRRRRARQLLGGGDPRARRRVGRRAGHRAARGTSRSRAFRAGAARPLPGAGLVANDGQRDPRHASGSSRWS